MAQLDSPALPAQSRSLADRVPFRHVDLALVGGAIALAVYGVLMVYSATHRGQAIRSLDPGFFVKRQAAFLAIGALAMAATAMFDYRHLRIWAPFIYGFFLLLLVAVQLPHVGQAALGAQRAFSVGGFQVSPSLFMRVVLILMLAAYLSNVHGAPSLLQVFRAVMLAAVPIVLVFIQPDLGTSIILATILVAELVIAGARARHLVILALVAVVGVVGALQLHVIKDFQLQRLQVFLNPSNEQLTAAYNLHQSEIAIGSGGISGRGYLKGTQTNLAFVPEQQTDFIFTVVGEEFGFVGAIVLLMLFLLVLWRAYRIALTSRDPFGTYVAIGVAAMFAVQIFVNVGMTIGIMPITGIPLPFISYGGSALIADFIGIGLLLSIHMRRQD
jgi:rod shape determining protein RodA